MTATVPAALPLIGGWRTRTVKLKASKVLNLFRNLRLNRLRVPLSLIQALAVVSRYTPGWVLAS